MSSISSYEGLALLGNGLILVLIGFGIALYVSDYDSDSDALTADVSNTIKSAVGWKFWNKFRVDKRDVFNVSESTFTYNQAGKVCLSLGAELATEDQVQDAYSRGASWCNYGWTAGQRAMFPMTEDHLNKLEGTGYQDKCGKVGVNAREFPVDMKLGVNCYGLKPAKIPISADIMPIVDNEYNVIQQLGNSGVITQLPNNL